ncbi:MAG: dipeptidase [Oscillospiraceae bacterium]|jgi:membrane dipeptidase|nr:dipeptidase [Oscillospiraceae bacterium]MDD3260916.1 dipeptidase [Oscillospiraceae bacterium]
MRFIDLHCDTLGVCAMHPGEKMQLAENNCQLDLKRLKQAGSMAQVFAAFLPTNEQAKKDGIALSPQEIFDQIYACYQKELRANRDTLAPVFCGEDLAKNDRAGLLSAILGIEDCVLLNGDLRKITTLYKKGVRVMTLTWWYENSLGFPCSPIPADMDRGLKPFGKKAVRKMQNLGILVDVSHLSDGGFYDVAALSRESHIPFAATHSCARALCQHPRNLTDDMLREIGETGSVCGINFCAKFLNSRGSNYTRIDDIVQCARYIRDKAGIDALAIGSDFDGIDSTLEFADCAGLPKLADALAMYFPSDEVEKICWKNALRVLTAALK